MHTSAIPQQIRTRREALGLSYGDLALRLHHRGINLNRQAISKLERGAKHYDFTDDELRRVADALRCKPEDLLIPPDIAKDAA